MNGEPSLHGIDTRLTVVEKNCERCSYEFARINSKLEVIHDELVANRVEKAEEKGRAGWKGALAGAASGGSVYGIAKLIAWVNGR